MISFERAQELKNAGFTQRITGNAEYFLNEHLMIRREDAIRMWYGDKAKEGWALNLTEELVYCPTVAELIEACGLPFYLSCDAASHWYAKNSPDGVDGKSGYGETAPEAIARLWLILHSTI
jgi:hypothetical protein